MTALERAYELAKEFCKDEKISTVNKLVNIVYEDKAKIEITFIREGVKVNDEIFLFNDFE